MRRWDSRQDRQGRKNAKAIKNIRAPDLPSSWRPCVPWRSWREDRTTGAL